MTQTSEIVIKGASENNLKALSCTIPRGKLVAVTGPSGSGKSSLVFDTIFRESCRRFLEVLLPTAEHVFGGFGATSVAEINGLSFAVAVEARPPAAHLPTLATATEIYDYLRLLFFHLGVSHCQQCGGIVAAASVDEISERIQAGYSGCNIEILAPLGTLAIEDTGRTARHFLSLGYTRARWGDETLPLSMLAEEKSERVSTVSLLVDAFRLSELNSSRLRESLNLALSIEASRVAVAVEQLSHEKPVEMVFSHYPSCLSCGVSSPQLMPGHFSYYSKTGCCENCGGRGEILPEADGRGCVLGHGFTCPACRGVRLKPHVASIELGGASFARIFSSPVIDLAGWVENLAFLLHPEQLKGGAHSLLLAQAVDEMRGRLADLVELGLGYLQLNRSLSSLSAGELQRVHLARELAGKMGGALYLFDEPTTGLHPEDTILLLKSLRRLVSRGASVLAVEHDLHFIREADFIIELGPGAGVKGGRLVASGTLPDLLQGDSLTATALRDKTDSAANRDYPHAGAACSRSLLLSGVTKHNLKNVDIAFPLGKIISVTGVSGSGKTSLVVDCLAGALSELFMTRKANKKVLLPQLDGFGERHELSAIIGWEALNNLVVSAERSVADNPRSIVATQADLLAALRRLYAKTFDARQRGLDERAFSFNTQAGWCGRCRGLGYEPVEIDHYPSFLLPCDVCGGRRYCSAVLGVRYRGMSIADVLELTVEECKERFSVIPELSDGLGVLTEVGLGYLTLSQPSSLLSSGELQRLRLARELVSGRRGETLYIFDEPTRGLHASEVDLLLRVLRGLTERGHSVVVIEHNTSLVRQTDYVIDLGPGAGEEGGRIIARGTPGEMRQCRESRIGKYL